MLCGLTASDRRALQQLITGKIRPNYGSVDAGVDVLVRDMGDVADFDANSASALQDHTVILLTSAQPVATPGVRTFGVHGGEFIPVGASPQPRSTRMDSAELYGRIEAELTDAGTPAESARAVARALVDADERGHASHGVGLLPIYLHRIAAGGIVADAQPILTAVAPAVASIDAAGGPGQVAADRAARWCAETAASRGLAAVAVHNNNHVGMLAAYRQPFQDHQVVGLLLNISGPSVAAPGARRATLGSNAMCLVTPGRPGDEPFCLDMGTGVVAAGKIRDASNRGASVPDGWLQDPDGRPTRDPAQLDAGGSIPLFGGYKGLCTTLLIEILAGALAGGLVSPHVRKQRKQSDAVMRCSQLFVGFSVEHFSGIGDRPDIPDLVQTLRRAVANGYDSLPEQPWFPDQAERRHTELVRSTGIPISASVLEELGWR